MDRHAITHNKYIIDYDLFNIHSSLATRRVASDLVIILGGFSQDDELGDSWGHHVCLRTQHDAPIYMYVIVCM